MFLQFTVYISISTHTPHARRDNAVAFTIGFVTNFNSHASCEAWQLTVSPTYSWRLFQLTRLMRGVTNKCLKKPYFFQFQLTRLMRGVTGDENGLCYFEKFQLTRLMRGVTAAGMSLNQYCTFQLTRLMRGVTTFIRENKTIKIFQLTRLMRGVTFGAFYIFIMVINFNSHASCEAWPPVTNV